MYLQRLRQGFTIVELLIVITVIAILVMITATIYQNVQVQARDTQLADSADKVADAVELFIQQQGHFPRGGLNSTSASGGSECVDGSGGWFAAQYNCTVRDTLVATGYLPSGFGDNLPANPALPTLPGRNIMVYTYGAPVTSAMVYYSMEDPSAENTRNFNAQLTACGINPGGVVAPRDSYGMRNGVCIQFSLPT